MKPAEGCWGFQRADAFHLQSVEVALLAAVCFQSAESPSLLDHSVDTSAAMTLLVCPLLGTLEFCYSK